MQLTCASLSVVVVDRYCFHLCVNTASTNLPERHFGMSRATIEVAADVKGLQPSGFPILLFKDGAKIMVAIIKG